MPNVEKWARVLASINQVVEADMHFVLGQWESQRQDGLKEVFDLAARHWQHQDYYEGPNYNW